MKGEDGRKAHLIGICGAGMSGVALMLREAGWQVSGSDDGFYPPVSDLLVRLGLPCSHPYAADNIPPDVGLIVIGKHAKLEPESNSEVRRAFEMADSGIARVCSYPQVLGELAAGRHSIVVAGSYGKSTTAALLSWILADSGTDPAYFIGAVPLDLPANAHLGSGPYFVLEGDEYPSSNWDHTSKFLHYNAKTVVLTSGEYDHFNEFHTVEEYLEPYRRLVRSLPQDGLLVGCVDGAHVRELVAEAPCRVVTYSSQTDSGSDYAATDPAHEGVLTRFYLKRRSGGTGEGSIDLETTLFGAHNLQNIAGACAALLEPGAVDAEQIRSAVGAFRGLKRRLELKTTRSAVPVYEDLSSSRPKAGAALSALESRYPESGIVAVFQPHTFSFRSRKALGWYPGMFDGCKSVLVFSPPNLRGLPSEEELTFEEIVGSIRSGNAADVLVAESVDQTVDLLRANVHPGDVILLMTSGAMGGAIDPIVQFAESVFRAPR